MTSKYLRFSLAAAALLAVSALAQTGSAATSSTPAAPAGGAAASPAPTVAGVKVGAISINDAIFACNEGQRDVNALQKKFEPKQAELKGQNDELESLKKQLNDQGSKLNDDALNNLKKQIEGKQKTFDRAVQDAQEEFGSQQQDIANRILGKMAPLIVKYAQENGFYMIIDTSKPWPQSPVLWWNPDSVDITKAVIDAYNTQSGVPAPTPPAGAAAKPAAPKPPTGTGTAPKPAAPKPTDPSK